MPGRPLRRSGSRVRRLVLRVGIGAIAITCLLVLAVWFQLSRVPAWWSARLLADPATDGRAVAVENMAANRIHAVRPRAAGRPESEPWTIEIPADDARAWLAARLPRWLENRGRPLPAAIGQVQADFAPGTVKLGAVARLSAGDYVLALTIEPSLDDSGALWVRARSLSAGRVSLPLSWLDSGLASAGLGRDLIDALAGRRPLAVDPELALEDGRRVRLVGIELRGGALVATCTTGRDEQGPR